MTEFLHNIEELFDIFCNDQKQRQKLEETNKLKMNKDDFAFYEDQIDPRKRKCLDVVEPIDQSDTNFLQKNFSKSNPILIIQFQHAQQILILQLVFNLIQVLVKIQKYQYHLIQRYLALQNLFSSRIELR